MTQEEIITGNKLIAEFMGCVYFTKSSFSEEKDYWEFREFIPYNGYGRVQTKELAFDSSWDWLMPVYSKAMQETENDGGDEYFDLQNYFEDAAMNNRIDLVFSAVVEFIKWYNLQK